MRTRQVVSACLSSIALCFGHGALAEPLTQEGMGPCGEALVARVASHLQLAHSDGEDRTDFIAWVCKAWSTDVGRTLAAFAYDGGGERQKQLALVVLDGAGQRVIASRTDVIPEDSAARVTSDSLTLDTARYLLRKDVRAFGLRLNTFLDRCTYEGGSGDELTLFVVDGRSIRPVFTEAMSHWIFGPGNRCDGDHAVQRIDVHVLVSVASTTSHGFADLKLTAVRTDNARVVVSGVVKYDGERYDLKRWRVALDAELVLLLQKE